MSERTRLVLPAASRLCPSVQARQQMSRMTQPRYVLSLRRAAEPLPARVAQDQRQRGPKVYSLHAPEVECIGKGKAHGPYEFGVKVSVATTGHPIPADV
jgi:hypothetical protein